MGNYGTWIWLLVMVAVFYFLIIRPQKKREKSERELRNSIQPGDEVSVDFDSGVITNITRGETYKAQAFPEFIQNIIRSGGLMNSIKNK